ncbi:hypothetical protein C8Q77DRAFT_1081053 [Trametes polyzona]|nr:hypothetical protein C8Q77DRAFT_1081053 [Trametes polyzona]
MSSNQRESRLIKLLEVPFGPYLEEEALTDACKSTTCNNVVALRQFVLECGGVTTGLDECETCQPGYDKHRFSSTPTRFSGILEIQQLSWLTEEAAEHIQGQLRARDVRARSTDGSRASSSNLSLRELYAPSPGFQGAKFRVKVTIIGVKHLPAVYLLSVHVPYGLMIVSQAQKRRYAVETMHINTYRLSRLYLRRYRIMQVLKNLLKLDAACNHHDDNKTPIEDRTPDWFIGLYMKHMAQPGIARRYRPVFDQESDSDVGPDGRMLGNREHIVRHVSRAEVYSMFAEHAEWIVAQVAAMSTRRWLDLDSWQLWLVDIRSTRREADKEGVRWGISPGVDMHLDHNAGGENDPTSRLQQRLGRKGKKKTKRGAQRPTSRTSTTNSSMQSADPPSAGPSRMRTPSPYLDDTVLRTYDPDFSPVSTPPGSPSSASSDGPPSRPVSPADPDLIALIPTEFLHPPQPSATFKWACGHCGYTIDLLRLTDENLDLAGDLISGDGRRRLKANAWSIRDAWACRAFAYMVDGHREKHFDELGLRLEMKNGVPKIVSKHPDVARAHSGRLRKVKVDNRRPAIKKEDN